MMSSSSTLVIPNLPTITKAAPQLGEALTAVQMQANTQPGPLKYAASAYVDATKGNRKAPPPATIANPTRRPG